MSVNQEEISLPIFAIGLLCLCQLLLFSEVFSNCVEPTIPQICMAGNCATFWSFSSDDFLLQIGGKCFTQIHVSHGLSVTDPLWPIHDGEDSLLDVFELVCIPPC